MARLCVRWLRLAMVVAMNDGWWKPWLAPAGRPDFLIAVISVLLAWTVVLALKGAIG